MERAHDNGDHEPRISDGDTASMSRRGVAVASVGVGQLGGAIVWDGVTPVSSLPDTMESCDRGGTTQGRLVGLRWSVSLAILIRAGESSTPPMCSGERRLDVLRDSIFSAWMRVVAVASTNEYRRA